MKKVIFLSIVFSSGLFLSACSVKDQINTHVLNQVDEVNTVVEQKVIQERSELSSEASSSSDKALLNDFDKDQDTDFTVQFDQLNSDLQ